MKTVLLYPSLALTWATASLALAIATFTARGQSLWINEFHYDNLGTDVDEFVEVAAPESLADLASVRLTLYNGGDGKPYGSSHLLSTFTPGESVNGFRFYSKLITGLQNGAPDGLALDVGGEVKHFISYEGTFTANAGPALGLLSSDVGVSELDTSPLGGALGMSGNGAGASDFVWNYELTASPDGLNSGQTVVPEPRTYALLTAGSLVAWAGWRRRRRVG